MSGAVKLSMVHVMLVVMPVITYTGSKVTSEIGKEEGESGVSQTELPTF